MSNEVPMSKPDVVEYKARGIDFGLHPPVTASITVMPDKIIVGDSATKSVAVINTDRMETRDA